MSELNPRNYGAVGDGAVDDTGAIQRTIDAAVTGDVVKFEEGRYYRLASGGVRAKSGIRISMYGSVLAMTNYAIPRSFGIEVPPGVEDVRIRGGTLIGNRVLSPGREFSVGVRMDHSEDVIVEDVECLDWYSDGFGISGNNPGCNNITIRNCTASNNRRNGMSISSGRGIHIENSVFKGSNSTDTNLPRCGVDVEPNPGEIVSDVWFRNCVFEKNQRSGLFIQSGKGQAGSGYVIDDCWFSDNEHIGLIVNQVKRVTIVGCEVYGDEAQCNVGISIGAGAQKVRLLDSGVMEGAVKTGGNAINFAGVRDIYADRVKVNGRRVAYIPVIVDGVQINGVEGMVEIHPFE